MKILIAACATWLAASAPLVAGSPEVACLQKQLNELGFEAGPADGLMGPNTRRAASDWQETTDLQLPPPSTRTAVTWCRAVGEVDGEQQEFWPSNGKMHVIVDYRPDLPPDKFTEIKTGTLTKLDGKARLFFLSRYGLQPVSEYGVTGASTVKVLRRNLTYLRDVAGDRTKYDDIHDGVCPGSAIAFRRQLAFCWISGSYNEAWSTATVSRLGSVYAHEMMHVLQRELAEALVPRRLPKGQSRYMGPGWMIEGTAEIVQREYDWQTYGHVVKPLSILRLRARSVKEPHTLKELRDYSGMQKNGAYSTAEFAARLLHDRFGEEVLFDYWHNLAREGTWNGAFRKTFGMSLKEFESEFEAALEDSSAALAFAKGE